MQLQARISAEKLRAKVGQEIEVIIDKNEKDRCIARSCSDVPEIDGVVLLGLNDSLNPGDIVKVRITQANNYDLTGYRG